MLQEDDVRKVADALLRLYVSYRGRYTILTSAGCYVVPKRNGKAMFLGKGIMNQHVRGQYAVSVYAGKKASKFICFDVDDGKEETVRTIIALLCRFGIDEAYIQVSTSGNKGYHVEVFFDQLVFTADLLRLYNWIIDEGGLNPQKVEFRPTHVQSIKLPLSINSKTGRKCWYLDKRTLDPIEDEKYILAIGQYPTEGLHALLQGIPVNDISTTQTEANTMPFSELIDVVASDYRLTQPGTRHNTMLALAITCHKNCMASEEIAQTLKDWYEAQDPALIRSSREVVLKDIAQIVKWVTSRGSGYEHTFSPSVQLGANEMDAIIALPTPAIRQMMFIYLIRARANRPAISTKKLAEMVGISEKTVVRSNKRMVEEGVVHVKRGTTKRNADGSFHVTWNQYFPSRTYLANHHSGLEAPGIRTISFSEMMKDFKAVYYRAMKALLPEWRIRERMVRRERLEYATETED